MHTHSATMGRRKKGQEETAATLKPRNPGKEDDDESSLPGNTMEEEEEEDGGANGKFFACYLLTSLSPRFKGHTYIGFTVNPKRRIRQHNGELRSGAWRTKKRRPWEMVLCIYGFPTNVAALQFEWAWQHPVESLAVRQAAVTFKSLSGLANKIKLAYTMLALPSWNSVNLTVNYFSTKYTTHAASCPRLPVQMRVRVCSMDELPCYTGSSFCENENDDCYCEDGGCEDSGGGSQESVEGEFVEAQILNDVMVVLDALEPDQYEGTKKKAGSMKRTVQKRKKNTRPGKKLDGSSGHDKKSDEELPFSLASHFEITTNTENSEAFRLSDELLTQPKKSGVGGKEIHKQSFQLNGSSVKAVSSSASSHSKMMAFAEDKEILISSNGVIRHGGENEVQKEPFQPSFSVSCGGKIASIAEQKERIFKLLDVCIDEGELVEHQQTSESTFQHKAQCARISSEIEVIDVVTPSPCYNATIGSKRRRRSETEIIDLTISPLVV